jgi:UrcA family protein
MTRRMFNVSQGALLALSAMFAATAANAGDTPVTSDVTVQAERPTTKVVGRTAFAPVILATVQYRISYSDLDLSIPTNAQLLKDRVRDAAREACKDLDKLYPITTSSSSECLRKTEQNATPQVLSAIAAAEARKTAAD